MEHDDARVFIARVPDAGYSEAPPQQYPELPPEARNTSALRALRRLFADARLDVSRRGTAAWNPLGDIIRPGDRVTIKPNWVLHENQNAAAGTECLITHPSVLDAILLYVAIARPSRVVIGDAPVQGCDFPRLARTCDISTGTRALEAVGAEGEVVDFRLAVGHGGRRAPNGQPPRDERRDYVMFDLGRDSLLEPLSASARQFRVTMYDPAAFVSTHGPGRHKYLIAREVIDSDVVINVPKLKTHKKAGVTGAIKNLVGINGHKKYLPHHRKGGTAHGGDCYPGGSPLKATAEGMLDLANGLQSERVQRHIARLASGLSWASDALRRTAIGVEGSWHGNDTVWRMCLDLQRVLHYGRIDGTMSDVCQRRIVHITDAIVAGSGDGPLASTPVSLGALTLATSAPAADCVHANMMGLAPDRIPLLREAFGCFRFPITSHRSNEVVAVVDGNETPVEELGPPHTPIFDLPAGWRGHCERQRPPR